MPRQVSWLRIITLANAFVAALVVLVVYGTMLALSALAPEISTWQLLTLLAVGVPMSIIGLRLATKVGLHVWRRRGLIINGSAIMLYAGIVIGLGSVLIGATQRRFIIPEGYKGDVYIVYSTVDRNLPRRTKPQLHSVFPPRGFYTPQCLWLAAGRGMSITTNAKLELGVASVIFGALRFNEHRRIWRTTRTLVCSFRAPAQLRTRPGARSSTKNSTSERKPTSCPASQRGTRIKS